jgi:hypothetical protein
MLRFRLEMSEGSSLEDVPECWCDIEEEGSSLVRTVDCRPISPDSRKAFLEVVDGAPAASGVVVSTRKEGDAEGAPSRTDRAI